MPTRTSPTGSYRFNRIFTVRGRRVRVQVASGARTEREFRARDALLTKLYQQGHDDLLLALARRAVTIEELVAADRRGGLRGSLVDLVLARPLWPEIAAVLPRMGKTPATRVRYQTSFGQLARLGVLGPAARVVDLEAVPWREVRARFAGGACDWNRLGAAVSAFLTVALGDKWHPVARGVRTAFPREREPERLPDVSPARWQAILEQVRPDLRPAFVTIVALGLRISEFLALEERHLRPVTSEVAVPGTKTTDASAVLPVDAASWPWVVAAVPCPVGAATLRAELARACAAAGAPRLRLHDLRHLTGQFLADAGVDLGRIRDFLRLRTYQMAVRYSRRTMRRAEAETLGAVAAPKLSRAHARGA